jgi:hypothetical protein
VERRQDAIDEEVAIAFELRHADWIPCIVKQPERLQKLVECLEIETAIENCRKRANVVGCGANSAETNS